MLFIHIGKRKTGTTSIQHFFASHEDELLEHGICYPRIGRDGVAHHKLGTSVLKRGERRGLSGPQLWGALGEHCRNHPDQKVLVSTESLEFADPSGLKAWLGEVPVKVLCYVRDTAAHVQSAYSQSSKFGVNLLNFDDYFQRRQSRDRLRFSDDLLAWASCFGPQQIRVRSLDADSLFGGQLLMDVLSALDAPAAALDLSRKAEGTFNQSPGWMTVELLRRAYSRARSSADVQRDLPRDDQDLGHAGLKAGQRLGLDKERGEYLTLAQFEMCNDCFAADAEVLRAAGIDSRIRVKPKSRDQERPFLPTWERIDSQIVQQFEGELERLLARRRSRRQSSGEVAG